MFQVLLSTEKGITLIHSQRKKEYLFCLSVILLKKRVIMHTMNLRSSLQEGKMKLFMASRFLIYCTWFVIVFVALPALSQGMVEGTKPDSTEVQLSEYPKRMPRKETWEHIVSLPGTMVLYPLKLGYKGVNELVTGLLIPQRVGAVYDFLHSDDGLRAADPTYKSRTGAGFKIYQKNLINEGSKLDFKATVGIRFRQEYELNFKRIRPLGNALRSSLLIRYRLLPDEYFYGIGPKTHKDDRSNFLQEQTFLSVNFGRAVGRKLDIVTTFSFEQNNIRKGKHPDYESTTELYPLAELPGLERGVKLLGVDAEMTYDSRNVKGRPTSGQEIMIGGGLFSQISDGEYGFWKARVELKQYIHLFFQRTLMLRLAGEMTEPISNKVVPFYYMSELGRSETIRGFNRGRFRDLDMVLGSVEYYYPVLFANEGSVDAFLFCDAGQVNTDIFEDFQLRDVQVGYGFGLRFSGEFAEALRVMVGRSKEQMRFYLEFNI